MSKVPHDSRTPHGELYRAFKEADAEIARLREAIVGFVLSWDEDEVGLQRRIDAIDRLRLIAREGR